MMSNQESEKVYSRRSSVRVAVPASTANLGPGFDTLGMALSLYSWLELKEAEQTSITLLGDQLYGIPTDKTNLIYKIAQSVFEKTGVSIPELEITMYSDIPLTRGLGSSASALIGALAAANALTGHLLSDEELLNMATAFEKHPDNVGASLYGGIIAATWDGEQARCIGIQPPEALQALVVIPEFQLSTTKARDVLPAQLSMADAVYNISRSSLLVAALSSGKLEMIREAMQDRLHQPYRAALIPGMEPILAHAAEYGALGIALSGAGPTMIALVDRHSAQKQQLENYLLQTMQSHGIAAQALWLEPVTEGVIYYYDTESSSFMDTVKGEVRL
ncbi:homoserine kinase [Paenibacillus dauci]|uniref:homoserine kinase n=1 Tax=Paenibacillus dauci TaxID=1567106 RepID=UPI0006193F21|nr:homoserine kinase [Paenibacillus dauci]